ncbi:hypothetical protein QTP86_020214, partial [Hemibagrus guttatus]
MSWPVTLLPHSSCGDQHFRFGGQFGSSTSGSAAILCALELFKDASDNHSPQDGLSSSPSALVVTYKTWEMRLQTYFAFPFEIWQTSKVQ